jgi:hypothetical protein
MVVFRGSGQSRADRNHTIDAIPAEVTMSSATEHCRTPAEAAVSTAARDLLRVRPLALFLSFLGGDEVLLLIRP